MQIKGLCTFAIMVCAIALVTQKKQKQSLDQVRPTVNDINVKILNWKENVGFGEVTIDNSKRECVITKFNDSILIGIPNNDGGYPAGTDREKSFLKFRLAIASHQKKKLDEQGYWSENSENEPTSNRKD